MKKGTTKLCPITEEISFHLSLVETCETIRNIQVLDEAHEIQQTYRTQLKTAKQIPKWAKKIIKQEIDKKVTKLEYLLQILSNKKPI